MINPWDELTAALDAAREVNRAVKTNRESMLRLLVGNLEGAPGYLLEAIKKELRGFNIRTGAWKK